MIRHRLTTRPTTNHDLANLRRLALAGFWQIDIARQLDRSQQWVNAWGRHERIKFAHSHIMPMPALPDGRKRARPRYDRPAKVFVAIALFALLASTAHAQGSYFTGTDGIRYWSPMPPVADPPPPKPQRRAVIDVAPHFVPQAYGTWGGNFVCDPLCHSLPVRAP